MPNIWLNVSYLTYETLPSTNLDTNNTFKHIWEVVSTTLKYFVLLLHVFTCIDLLPLTGTCGCFLCGQMYVWHPWNLKTNPFDWLHVNSCQYLESIHHVTYTLRTFMWDLQIWCYFSSFVNCNSIFYSLRQSFRLQLNLIYNIKIIGFNFANRSLVVPIYHDCTIFCERNNLTYVVKSGEFTFNFDKLHLDLFILK